MITLVIVQNLFFFKPRVLTSYEWRYFEDYSFYCFPLLIQKGFLGPTLGEELFC